MNHNSRPHSRASHIKTQLCLFNIHGWNHLIFRVAWSVISGIRVGMMFLRSEIFNIYSMRSPVSVEREREREWETALRSDKAGEGAGGFDQPCRSSLVQLGSGQAARSESAVEYLAGRVSSQFCTAQAAELLLIKQIRSRRKLVLMRLRIC